MNETKIFLAGGNLYLTKQPDSVYRVENGKALIERK